MKRFLSRTSFRGVVILLALSAMGDMQYLFASRPLPPGKHGRAVSPAQKSPRVKVRLQAGIYRKWDKTWMTTAPEDVVVKLTSSAGAVEKHPVDYTGLVAFDHVPCGEVVNINLRFVGTADYASNSRSYSRRLGCNRAVVNLGRLEYGTWK